MAYISCTIKGVPFGKFKKRGDIAAPKRWTEEIRRQTQALPRVREACVMKVTFLLPRQSYPSDHPYGTDLDNLLKLFLDALKKTVLSEAPGQDGCVVAIIAMKVPVASNEETGVHFEVLPVVVEKGSV
ncbi:MAG: RusA family crossover junction endodeoxyribonuclease [Terriglobia bacterium]